MLKKNFTRRFIICFDIDNTICHTNKAKEYKKSKKNNEAIRVVNNLYKKGYYIKLYTSRGMSRYEGDLNKINKYLRPFTRKQLKKWNILYHELIFGKTDYNLFIDDKSYGFKKNWSKTLLKALSKKQDS
jgi:capsule biosynthesis phosphatase